MARSSLYCEDGIDESIFDRPRRRDRGFTAVAADGTARNFKGPGAYIRACHWLDQVQPQYADRGFTIDRKQAIGFVRHAAAPVVLTDAELS
jgi:hypothetical protein